VLQYVLGLRELGHEVILVDPIRPATTGPVDAPLEDSCAGAYFERVTRAFGIERTSALLVEGTEHTLGLSYRELLATAESADLLINMSGTLSDEALRARVPLRLYLDIDPGFSQLWQHAQGVDMRFAGHTHHATIGMAIGAPGCTVPTCGIRWIATPQPVVLSHWPPAERVVHNAFTTVANWRAYGSIEHDSVFYGQKAHSLRRFIDLPTRARARFALALAIHTDEAPDLAALAANRWQLLDPAQVAGTPDRYRAFVRGSKAELGIAKSGYVAARCGWFSDRSICYLASGRPVVAQDTGFGAFVRTGEGLLAFESGDDAAAAIEAIERDYHRHARAARELAVEFFESGEVLGRLLRQIGAVP
jgi:hypothetical protein